MIHRLALPVMVVVTALVLWLSVHEVSAQAPIGSRRAPNALVGNGFTYQGRLKMGGVPINGTCDLNFNLYDAESLGNTVGMPLARSNIQFSNGLFTVPDLDFGVDAITNQARWIGIAVRCPAGGGSFTTLEPRQRLAPVPFALYAKTIYARTVVVSPVGTPAENGTRLLDALAGITTNSSASPFLLKIEPGIYDLGAASLVLKSYVDVEGSGEIATKITGTGHVGSVVATVMSASNTELRGLTVENSGGADYAVAIYNGSGSPRLSHVTATAFGGTQTSYAVHNNNSTPTITHLTATASGAPINYGVLNLDSGATISESNIIAKGLGTTVGIYNSATAGGYNVQIDRSRILGSTHTIRSDAEFITRVGASQLVGGAVDANGGVLTCFGVYDELYTNAGGLAACP